jgi:putative hemolysin
MENEMKTTIFRKEFAVLLIAMFLVSACASQTPQPANPEQPEETMPGMPNPAAVYCEGLGYQMEAVTRDGGEDADCVFPDDSHCPQWDFFAGRCGTAFTYCSTQGFTLEIEDNIAICRFPDGSFCEEFQYFSGDCSPGDQPGMAIEEPAQIIDVVQARDFMAEYFDTLYGIQLFEAWIEQDITPADAVGSSTTRFVSGPMTIVISAPASAPSPALYTIEEASYLSNGFYWEGTLSFEGDVTETKAIPPATILNEVQARDKVIEYVVSTYDLPAYGEWTNQEIPPGDAGLVKRVYTSGPWVITIEYAPAAPLVPSYHAIVDNLSEELRWEGDITYHGEIDEIHFTQLEG